MHNLVGYRITPPVATLNIHSIANAVSEWNANEWDANDENNNETARQAKKGFDLLAFFPFCCSGYLWFGESVMRLGFVMGWARSFFLFPPGISGISFVGGDDFCVACRRFSSGL